MTNMLICQLIVDTYLYQLENFHHSPVSPNFLFSSTRLLTTMHTSIHVSLSGSSTYFRPMSRSSYFDVKKTFKTSKSLISNSWAIYFLNFCISSLSFLVKIMSSIYTIKAVTFPCKDRLMNNVDQLASGCSYTFA